MGNTAWTRHPKFIETCHVVVIVRKLRCPEYWLAEYTGCSQMLYDGRRVVPVWNRVTLNDDPDWKDWHEGWKRCDVVLSRIACEVDWRKQAWIKGWIVDSWVLSREWKSWGVRSIRGISLSQKTKVLIALTRRCRVSGTANSDEPNVGNIDLCQARNLHNFVCLERCS